MANVYVYIETEGDNASPSSLEALGEGRRIASRLGATLYALWPGDGDPDQVCAELGRHGADRVVLLQGAAGDLRGLAMALTPFWRAHPPALILFAASSVAGGSLAPRLATRLGAVFLAQAQVEYGGAGEVVLSLRRVGGSLRRRLSLERVERPVLATLPPRSYGPATGTNDAGRLSFALERQPAPRLVCASERPDPGAALPNARAIVTVGAGVAPGDLPLCQALARAVNGELAFTREAAQLGLGPVERVVGLTGHLVHPQAYWAIGASGSPEHLSALGPDTEIIALNADPHAPIFSQASHALLGPIAETIPALLAGLATEPKPRAPTKGDA